MTAGKKGYFLLDAVLATLILSILLSAVLVSLETSLKALRKVNSDMVLLYKVEGILVNKMILRDDFENSGYVDVDKNEDIFYSLTVQPLEIDMSRVYAVVNKGDNKQARISTLVLN